MIPVARTDRQRALAMLDIHAEGPIFLQSNLCHHGLAGKDPRSLRMWRTEDWRGFVGLTNNRVLLPQMRDAGDADWAGLKAALAGHRVAGMNGASAQIARIREALHISDTATILDREEPCFRLELVDLVLPESAGFTLRRLTPNDRRVLCEWRAAYRVEILGDRPEMAAEGAAGEVDEWLRTDSHRLLWQGGHPVSLAGINASLPGLVQVGGVYTPPQLRGRGLARRAVAKLLADHRDRGITRAMLFAASNDAARAYRAIGFLPAGRMRIVIHENPVEIGT